MKIDFEPIASVSDVEEALAIIEIRTLFHGVTYLADLEWDEDTLLASFLEKVEDTATREDFAHERVAGIQEAKDRLLSELYALITQRHGKLGDNSPFRWRFKDGLLLERRARSELTIASIGYLWMTFHGLLQSDKNYLIMEATDRERFRLEFTAAFEQICCYAIAGYRPAAVWYFGSSRNVTDFLSQLRNLTLACGNGRPKSYDQLEENQRGANDGGVDLIAVELQDGGIRPSALAFLVGATLQKSDRRGKIMGVPEINRFTAFFQERPLLAYKGVLAVPFPRSLIEAQNCRDQDGLYFGREDLLLYLGQVPTERTRGHLRYPGAKLRRATERLIDGLVIASNDADLPLRVEEAPAAVA